MAKGDVTLKFDANTAEYVQQVLKAKDALMATADATRKIGDHADRSGEKVNKMARDIGSSVASSLGLVTSAAGAAGAAVTLGFKAAEEIMDKIAKKAEAARTAVQTLGSAMAAAGTSGQYGAVSQQLGQMANQTVGSAEFSKSELTRVYAALSSKEGFKSTPQEILAGVSAYQKGRAASMNEQAAIEMATKYVHLSGLGLQDTAYAAQMYGFDDGDERVVNRAKDKRAAMMMVLASKRVAEGSKTLQAIEAEAALAEEDPHTLSHEQRIAQRKMKAAMAASGKDAFATILEQPELLKDEKQREAVRNIARGAAEIAAGGLPTIEHGIDRTESNRELHEAIVWEKNTQAKNERATASGGGPALTANRISERMQANFGTDHPLMWSYFQNAVGPGQAAQQDKEMAPVTQVQNALEANIAPLPWYARWGARIAANNILPYAMAAGQESQAGQPDGDKQTKILQDIHQAIVTTPATNRTTTLDTGGREDR